MMQNTLSLLRLLQLASPTLPVGAYSYSQGLEHAVDAGMVSDEASAARWIEGVLRLSVATFDVPCLLVMMNAAQADDAGGLAHWNACYLASRESAELRAETVQLGHSLVRLLGQLGDLPRSLVQSAQALAEPSYPCAWACAACAFNVPATDAIAAYSWAWLENQVLAAVKLVPLGQSAGQRILFRLAPVVSELSARPGTDPSRWTNFAPGLALASVAHETQYTRLFRS